MNYISSMISDLIFIIFDFYYKDHSNSYYCEFENSFSKNFLLRKTNPFMLNKTDVKLNIIKLYLKIIIKLIMNEFWLLRNY